MSFFTPVQQLADFLTYQVLNLMPTSYLGSAVSYFIYDVIKIGLMLVIINHLMAVIRYYLPVEKVRQILTQRRWYGLDYLLAALLGMITPFCSCSSIPLFMGFLSAGVPIGVTFTFLISSPLINESSLYLFPAIFGFKIALIYNLLGLVISMVGGWLIEKLNLGRYIQPEYLRFTHQKLTKTETISEKKSWLYLVKAWSKEATGITKSILPYLIIGVFIGGLIHGYVPQDLATKYLAIKSWWVVPLATLIGVPFYANSVSVIPVMEALIVKGIPLGTALAFMTATVTLSLPEALMLKKVLRWQLLAAFFGITTLGIMVMGYIFNVI